MTSKIFTQLLRKHLDRNEILCITFSHQHLISYNRDRKFKFNLTYPDKLIEALLVTYNRFVEQAIVDLNILGKVSIDIERALSCKGNEVLIIRIIYHVQD